MLELQPQVAGVRDNPISSRINLERTYPPMSYVFLENLKLLRKGFEVVIMPVETGKRSELL